MNLDHTQPPQVERIEGQVMPVNSYIVSGPDGVVVVDGQLTLPDAARVREAIDRRGQDVAALVVTHPHPDHYAGAAEILRGLEAPIVVRELLLQRGKIRQPPLEMTVHEVGVHSVVDDVTGEGADALEPPQRVGVGLTRTDLADLEVESGQSHRGSRLDDLVGEPPLPRPGIAHHRPDDPILLLVALAAITSVGASISVVLRESGGGAVSDGAGILLGGSVAATLVGLAALELVLHREPGEPTHVALSPAIKCVAGVVLALVSVLVPRLEPSQLLLLCIAALALPASYGVVVWYSDENALRPMDPLATERTP